MLEMLGPCCSILQPMVTCNLRFGPAAGSQIPGCCRRRRGLPGPLILRGHDGQGA